MDLELATRPTTTVLRRCPWSIAQILNTSHRPVARVTITADCSTIFSIYYTQMKRLVLKLPLRVCARLALIISGMLLLAAAAPATQGPASEITVPADNTSPNLSTGSVFFIGNATVLIRYAGFTILTDPNFIP
jgi:hypothetical protein